MKKVRIFLYFVLFVLVAMLPAFGYKSVVLPTENVWDAPAIIDGAYGNGWGQDVASASNGNAIATWVQYYQGRYNIWVKDYIAGQGWGRTALVQAGIGYVRDGPKIAIVQDTAIIVWTEYGNGRYSLWSAIYRQGASVVGIVDNNTDNSWSPCIAANQNAAIVVWISSDRRQDSMWSNHYILGRGWGNPVLIENSGGYVLDSPKVVADGNGNAFACWVQWNNAYNIRANKYVNGQGWTRSVLIKENATFALSPNVVLVQDTAIIIWTQYDGGRYNLRAATYREGTSATDIVVDSGIGDTWFPDVAASQNSATVMWIQNDGRQSNVWANRYVFGRGWESPVLVESNARGYVLGLQVVADENGKVVAGWRRDNDIGYEIRACSYLQGWSAVTVLESSSYYTFGPRVAIASGNAIAVWVRDYGAYFGILASRFH